MCIYLLICIYYLYMFLHIEINICLLNHVNKKLCLRKCVII